MEEPLLSPPPSPRRHGGRTLGVLSVVSLIFFNVSGGPLGSEGIISAAGPVIGLVSMVAFVLLFSVPQAMITAEVRVTSSYPCVPEIRAHAAAMCLVVQLSTAFPDNGGYSLWVKAAFGNFWAVQESYWSWFSGVVDSALYPVLLYSTARELLASIGYEVGTHHGNVLSCLHSDPSCAREYGLKLAIVFVFTVPNVISSQLVGRIVTMLAVLVLAPYVALSLVGLPQVRAANLLRAPAHPRLERMLSILYWSLSGFDSASTFAGEVELPSVTFPKALSLAVITMLLAYIIPLAIAAGADAQWDTWRDGSLAAVGRRIGGEWLGVWIMASSCLSNWGLYASEVLEDSYQLLGTVPT